MRLFLLLLALTLTAGACATPPNTDSAMEDNMDHMSDDASAAKTVALDSPFAIEQGTWVDIAEEDVEIRFDSVTSDSRCPANATCVRAGEAYAHFVLFEDSNATAFTLEMPGLVMEMPDAERVTFERVDRFVVALYLLQPYPELTAEEGMPPTATLEMRRLTR